MLDIIVVAVDSSTNQQAILDQAAELAILSGAKIHVASVADATGRGIMAVHATSSGMFKTVEHEVGEVLRKACRHLSDRGVSCQTHSLNGLVSEQIISLASELKADLILVGHRHLTWIQRFFENSVGRDLLTNSPCNVLVVMGRKIEQ
jgi:nucleotide-binding universal stress UspA family protein